MNALLTLFLAFFKIGLFSVGGGLATLPFLTELAQQHPQWFAAPTLADIIAIAESTPGPIGVNASTFAGYSAAGVPGAIVATLSLILPSLIVVSTIAKFWGKYRSSALVENAFSGLRPAVAGLIAAAGYSLLKTAVVTGPISGGILNAVSPVRAILFAFLLFGTQWNKTKKLHPVLFIAIGAAVGVALGL